MPEVERRTSVLALAYLVAHAAGCASRDDAAAGAADPPRTACGAPAHPFLAPAGDSNLHGDAYMSDTYEAAGPPAASDVVRGALGGECATVTVDARGRLVTVCIAISGDKHVLLLDPRSLAVLARWDGLPRGLSTNSFGAGGYFYLDEKSRAVVPAMDGTIVRLAIDDGAGAPAFVVDARFDLATVGLAPADGSVESALPDWSGRIWFVTEAGAVGFVDPRSGAGSIVRLAGESIGNSFAVDETGGVFVVSDHALYRFDVDARGAPVVTFREAYDRGTRKKPGQVNFGSGTTPTLLDGDLVAITDNADPEMHVLVYARGASREGARLVCSAAVFDPGASATENSLIGCGRSLVVENNYGYTSLVDFAGARTTTPGLARVDLREGGQGCDVVWTSRAAAPSAVAKLSLASDAVYTYTKSPAGWSLTAVDFATGDVRFDLPIGGEAAVNNNYAPVTIGRAGVAYVGVLSGLLAFVPK